MHPHDGMMEKITEKVSQQMVEGLKDAITRAVEKELASSLSSSLVESEFYRRLSEDMRSGLQNIYKEIATATRSDAAGGDALAPAPAMTSEKQAGKLFNEASEQLDEILTTTQRATEDIMDIVEKHMAMQNEAQALLAGLRKTRKSNPSIQKLIDINEDLGENLLNIMTALSFQDLTGQRIKKIITALKSIEGIVFDLYMSTGLMIKHREEQPGKDIEALADESKKKVSELKGPASDGKSQGEVDDLLAQLGLD